MILLEEHANGYDKENGLYTITRAKKECIELDLSVVCGWYYMQEFVQSKGSYIK